MVKVEAEQILCSMKPVFRLASVIAYDFLVRKFRWFCNLLIYSKIDASGSTE